MSWVAICWRIHAEPTEPKLFSPRGSMFSKKLLVSVVLLLIGATAIAVAQNDLAVRSNGTMVWGKHARMTLVAEPAPTRTTTNFKDSGLVAIFSNLAAKYPKGQYWCCSGYNVMGPSQGEQWMAAAFTPRADHTVTRIEIAAGWSQTGANG